MFLLNQYGLPPIVTLTLFTFHYVSIKSTLDPQDLNFELAFTFHYVSIKSKIEEVKNKVEKNLHSTMFLLNPTSSFISLVLLDNLHSTMFLLNQQRIYLRYLIAKFTFHYVSIKSSACRSCLSNLCIFTFHYVSIKS